VEYLFGKIPIMTSQGESRLTKCQHLGLS